MKKITLDTDDFDDSTLAELDRRAEKLGVSRSEYLNIMLQQTVGDELGDSGDTEAQTRDDDPHTETTIAKGESEDELPPGIQSEIDEFEETVAEMVSRVQAARQIAENSAAYSAAVWHEVKSEVPEAERRRAMNQAAEQLGVDPEKIGFDIDAACTEPGRGTAIPFDDEDDGTSGETAPDEPAQ